MFSLNDAKRSLLLLDVSVNRDTLRKCARAKYLLDNGHIKPVGHEGIWRVYHVASQWTGSEMDGGLYTVKVNGHAHSCTCPDSSEICKHRISAMMHEYKNPYIVLTPEDREELNQFIDEENAKVPDPEPDNFDHFLKCDMANWKMTHLQSVTGGGSHVVNTPVIVVRFIAVPLSSMDA